MSSNKLFGTPMASSAELTAVDEAKLDKTARGVASGVASLGTDGRVPVGELPSYVDEILEYDTFSAFPATGESDKIYLAKDTNLIYRWGGTQYAEVSQSLALGETEQTAFRGDHGKTAYDHATATGNPHGTTASQVGALPLSGGTMTGNVVFSEGTKLSFQSTSISSVIHSGLPNGCITIAGGARGTASCKLVLTGPTSTAGFADSFLLQTHSPQHSFLGKNDGSLLWDNEQIQTSAHKGVADGIASLNDTGKVPASQLPSYVDDVLEYDNKASFPATGETGIIYVAKDTNKIYRWSGTDYIEISQSLALGTTVDSAYNGRDGLIAYNHANATGNPHGTTASDVNALPLSGGTMTGTIVSNQSFNADTIRSETDSSQVIIRGGSGSGKGATLLLNGKDITSSSAGKGGFSMSAVSVDGETTTSSALVGKPDGTLTWGGNNVLTAGNTSVSATGTATDVVNYITVNGVQKKLGPTMQEIYNAIHPVGEVVLGFSAPTVPTGVTATWEDQSASMSGRALWIDSAQPAGTVLDGSLPNIEGNIHRTWETFYSQSASGAFSSTAIHSYNTNVPSDSKSGSKFDWCDLTLKASDSNSVYGAEAGANVVRPTAVVIKVYCRTA